MLSLLLAASLVVAQVPDTAHVVLVATTDVHGRTTGWDYVAHRPAPGGLARVAPIVDSLRRRYPGQVVVLDAGDLLQGDPFATYFARVRPRTPHPIIEAMNLVGYDAATPGNHDFDFGVDALFRARRRCRVPLRQRQHLRRAGRHARLRAVPRAPARRRAGRHHRLHHARRDGLGPEPAQGFRSEWRRSTGRRPPPCRRCGRRPTSPWCWSTAAWTAPPPTTRPGSAPRTSRRRWHRSRSGRTSSSSATPTARCATRCSTGCTSSSRGRTRGGVSIVHLDLRRVKGRWNVTRIRGEALPITDRPVSPLLTQRLASSHIAVQAWVDEAVGYSPTPLRAARCQGPPDGRFRISSTRCSAAGPAPTSPPAPRSTSGPASTPTRSAGARCWRSIPTTTPCAPCGSAARSSRPTWSGARGTSGWTRPARIAINDSVPGYNFDLVRGRALRHRPAAAPGRADPEPDRPRPAGAAGRQLHPRRQQPSADRAPAATPCFAAPRWCTTNENIPELLIEEIRSAAAWIPRRFRLRSGASCRRSRDRGTPDLRHRSRRGAGLAAGHGDAPHPRHRRPPRRPAPAGRPAGPRHGQPRRRLRLPHAAARRGRRDAGRPRRQRDRGRAVARGARPAGLRGRRRSATTTSTGRWTRCDVRVDGVEASVGWRRTCSTAPPAGARTG